MSRFHTLIGGLVLGLAAFGGMAFFAAASAQESTTVTGRRHPIYPRFEIDVLVDGRPLREYSERGRTYIEALRGEEYEIRLRNRSDDRVAVALSVDGLNTIDASRTSAWDASKWVIGPHQTITISGWQMSSEHARRFYFTDERDSYAAKLGRRGNLGVISAVFFRERRHAVPITPPAPYPIYRDERESSADSPATGSTSAGSPAAAAKSRSRRDDAATGIGRSVHHDVRRIDMDLDSHPAAEFTIRYEYRRSTYGPDPRYIVPGKRDN